MSRKLLAVTAAVLCFSAAPAFAYGGHHHGGGVSIGLGLGGVFPYGGFYGGYGGPYYGFGYSDYMEPSRVVYTAPAPPPVTYVMPTTYYVQPAYVSTVAQPQVVQQQQAVPVGTASEAFTDTVGRTCRNFQSTLNGAPITGTACLQPDGSWRTVGQ